MARHRQHGGAGTPNRPALPSGCGRRVLERGRRPRRVAILREFGRVDILVNNAALARGADRVPLTELSEQMWRKVLDVKLTGSFLMTKAILPAMIAGGAGGSIVNISSIAGKRGSANTAAYCVSNFGIQGFTQALAMELGRAHV